jgi:hypothetical protein
MVGEPRGTRQPPPPEADRVVEPRGRVVDIDGRDQPVLPGKRDIRAIAGRQSVPGANSGALDPELEIGLQPDRLAGARRVSHVPVAVDQGPFTRRAPVVERRLAHQLDLDLSVQAPDRAHHHVLGVLVRRRTGVRGHHVLALGRSHHQRIAHLHPPPRGLPRRDQDVGSGFVVATGRNVDAERREAEHAALAVQQRAEHAR